MAKGGGNTMVVRNKWGGKTTRKKRAAGSTEIASEKSETPKHLSMKVKLSVPEV